MSAKHKTRFRLLRGSKKKTTLIDYTVDSRDGDKNYRRSDQPNNSVTVEVNLVVTVGQRQKTTGSPESTKR